MARIKTYTVDTTVSDKDIVIGTDGDNNGKTKNFQVSDLRQYLLSGLDPETGGNLKITTISATDEVNLTPEDYFNNSEEPIVVLHYEIVFLILNGRTFIFRKNNDIYGFGETQVISSDFTEIDITSVITSTLESQDLNSVLVNGNESLIDAKIGSIYLYDDNNEDGYVRISGYEGRINFYSKDNVNYGYISQNSISMSNPFDQYVLNINKPNITDSDKNATFQNASGTVAYLSDIDDAIEGISVGALDIESSDQTVSIINNDGVYDLSVGYRAYVTDTQLRDSLTNTTFYQQGGVFDFDTDTIPINSIRFQFNTTIGSSLESGNYGIVYFLYENGSANYYPLQFSDVVISGSTLTAVFPLEDYWSDVVGERVSVIDLTLYPECVKAVGGNTFEGPISGTISKYIYKWK